VHLLLAGKTTSVQMLTGALVPTAGRALLAGLDVVTQQEAVRRLVGYCPQFDALFDNLTVREHLELYGRLKGIPPSQIAREVRKVVQELSLGDFVNKLAGTLSGARWCWAACVARVELFSLAAFIVFHRSFFTLRDVAGPLSTLQEATSASCLSPWPSSATHRSSSLTSRRLAWVGARVQV
jgi:ABC-type lipopolysaccharide export system ATPase subunit